MDSMELARQERMDLADYLGDLDATAWDRPSLCEGWSVRDVAVHIVSYDGLGFGPLAARFIQGRFLPDRINAAGVQANRNLSAEELVGLVRQHATPRGLTAGFGGAIGLTDTLIHHQDIRLALDHPRDIPPERLRKALPFAMVAPPVRGAWTARGLKVVAPDVGWHFGRGKVVEGPAQAVLMAVAGRRPTLDDLRGPGSRCCAVASAEGSRIWTRAARHLSPSAARASRLAPSIQELHLTHSPGSGRAELGSVLTGMGGVVALRDLCARPLWDVMDQATANRQ